MGEDRIICVEGNFEEYSKGKEDNISSIRYDYSLDANQKLREVLMIKLGEGYNGSAIFEETKLKKISPELRVKLRELKKSNPKIIEEFLEVMSDRARNLLERLVR